jgi:hypothetical protein
MESGRQDGACHGWYSRHRVRSSLFFLFSLCSSRFATSAWFVIIIPVETFVLHSNWQVPFMLFFFWCFLFSGDWFVEFVVLVAVSGMNFLWWYHGVDFAVSRVQVEICKHSWHLEFVPDGILAPFCLCVDMCWKITYCRVSEAYSTLCLWSIEAELPFLSFWRLQHNVNFWVLSLFYFLSSFLSVFPLLCCFVLFVTSFCCKSESNRKTQPWYWLVVVSGELWSPLGLVCFSTVFCFLCVCFGFPSSSLSVFPLLCCFVVSC